MAGEVLPEPDDGILKQVVGFFELPDRRDVTQNVLSQQAKSSHGDFEQFLESCFVACFMPVQPITNFQRRF